MWVYPDHHPVPHQVCRRCKLRVSSWNVGTMHGRASEVVETLGHRCIDTCCVQQSPWKGCSARLISAKSFKYNFIWSGENSGFGGFGVLLKACVRYFHQIFIFSPNDSPSKTMKNAFYFIQKALFVLEIFKFLYFCPSLFFSTCRPLL